jgi:pilus assembly protein CpaB
MKNRRRIIGIVAAVLLALIGTMSLVGYVRSEKDKAVADEALVEVYVVDDLVPKGAEADTIRSAVTVEEVPARLVQSGAITDLTLLEDNVAGADLQPGDQLLEARLVPRAQVAEEVADKVQVSALLEAERAVGGALQKGDLVGVYLSFDPFELDEAGAGAAAPTDPAAADPAADAEGPTHTPNVSRLEFRHVLVTNVQTINAPVSTEDDEAEVAQVTGTQYVVTLALSPEQSERFVFATEFGHVRLSIDPASVADDGTRPVTLDNVYVVVT